MDLISSRMKAFRIAASSIKPGANLPHQVFSGAWQSFLFFEPEWFFDSTFVDTTKALLSVENATACCILNVSAPTPETFEAADSFYIDADTEAASYKGRVLLGGAHAWIIGVDHFVCASDSGNWAIYSEKVEDTAIIAVRDEALVSKFTPAFENLRAASLDVYINRPDSGPFPAIPLLEAWKTAIVKNYSTQSR